MNYQDIITGMLGTWAAGINAASICFRLALALLFAAVIGWERASKRHSAGLRTFIAITLSSTTAMLIDTILMENGREILPVLSAVSLIGAVVTAGYSTVYSSRNQIKGLTTAAALWCCSLIGIALGGGYYFPAVLAFIALLVCISRLPALEKYLKDRSNHFEVHLELQSQTNLKEFVSMVRELGMRVDDLEANPAYQRSGLSVYTVALTIQSEELKRFKTHTEIIEALRSLDYISHIEEI
ncbi:MAG: MgtC/SapB family protein [Erysipelotrichaceae bacterium]|nr:MgtC/SapB family protein [Erysipelotrichaceae bacterium]